MSFARRPLSVGRQTQMIATQDSTWVQRNALLVDMISEDASVWEAIKKEREVLTYKSCLLG